MKLILKKGSMMVCMKNILLSVVCMATIAFVSLKAHDILIEAKAAYFLSTNHTFKKIYNHGGGIYGGEITCNLYGCENLYGFFSADFLSKKGNSIGLCTPTKVDIANLGFGLKYLFPFCYGDFYVGLGVLPTHLRTNDCSPYVIPKRSKWGCGGIAKMGAIFDLEKSYFLDVYFDYSFANVPFKCCQNQITQPRTAHLNGCWFGAGFGYRFN